MQSTLIAWSAEPQLVETCGNSGWFPHGGQCACRLESETRCRLYRGAKHPLGIAFRGVSESSPKALHFEWSGISSRIHGAAAT